MADIPDLHAEDAGTSRPAVSLGASSRASSGIGMSSPVSNAELVALAATALNPTQTPSGEWLADVGAALEDSSGRVHVGACIGGYLGICAEQAAAGQLVQHADGAVRRMVAVWRRPETGELNVLPPCGRCREFVHGLHPQNLDTMVVLGPDHTASLRELLPVAMWHAEPVAG